MALTRTMMLVTVLDRVYSRKTKLEAAKEMAHLPQAVLVKQGGT